MAGPPPPPPPLLLTLNHDPGPEPEPETLLELLKFRNALIVGVGEGLSAGVDQMRSRIAAALSRVDKPSMALLFALTRPTLSSRMCRVVWVGFARVSVEGDVKTQLFRSQPPAKVPAMLACNCIRAGQVESLAPSLAGALEGLSTEDESIIRACMIMPL